MPNETAMLLTQQEWDDLAAICGAYKGQFAAGAYASEQIARRVRLADRIIDAAEV